MRQPVVLLRFGLAFVFFYAAFGSFTNPQNWVGYLPRFLTDAVSSSFLLPAFSVYEILLGAWLLWGKRLKWAALLSFATLAGITVFNFSVFEVTFRDVGLALAALALSKMGEGRG